jgi:hypothetical protein
MRTFLKAAAAAGLLFLSACAALPEKAPMMAASAMEQSGLGEVSAQTLSPGQCALVLWARRMPPSRILVTLDKPAIARIGIGGKQFELVRVSQSGQPLHGHYPEQRFSGAGVSVGVSFAARDARDISGGAVLSSVIVEYVDEKGWASVIPASGLIGCQA